MKPIVTLILIAMVMTSCSTTKTTYEIGNGYRPASIKSTVTGWTYNK